MREYFSQDFVVDSNCESTLSTDPIDSSPFLQVHLGLHGAFWLYSAVSVVGLVFAVVFVPETKGRTLDEMEPKVSEGDGGGVGTVGERFLEVCCRGGSVLESVFNFNN